MTRGFQAPRLNDANGRPLALGKSIWLMAKFSNTLYQVRLLVADKLEVDVTDFINSHVKAILCARQIIKFRNGELLILKQGSGNIYGKITPLAERKWSDGPTKTIETRGRTMREAKRERTEHHEFRIRLCERTVVQGRSKVKFRVTTDTSGFVVIKPRAM